MNAETDPLRPGTSSYWLRISLAPICLCLVAGFHFYRVHWCDQTPWKGGGFGMFSTVDTKDARFLRAYLRVGDREIPVAVPKWLEKRSDELCAAPDREVLDQMAERLADLAWIDREQRWAQVAQRAQGLQDVPTVGSEIFVSHRADAHLPQGPIDGRRCDVEAVSAGIAAREPGSRVRPESVRLELWRYRFDTTTCELKAERMWETTQRVKATEL